MISDAVFKYASATAAKLHLRGARSSVYFYHFGYRGNLSYSAFSDPTRNYGVSHADELLYLFPVHEVLFPTSGMSEEDFRTVDVMTTLWTNFAKFGWVLIMELSYWIQWAINFDFCTENPSLHLHQDFPWNGNLLQLMPLKHSPSRVLPISGCLEMCSKIWLTCGLVSAVALAFRVRSNCLLLDIIISKICMCCS